ncbi:DUF6090 family protein [Winogradskyella sp. A2]|uniref:DUF6090 family protein n=1 Tax=Winogradskyella sp. A2 TaxID=3366944 RepID=UPI00398C2590
MIKFFRKIRFDLMEKNKTGKYLKYAIGEIVLVVIGILIALSINNWNESDNLSKKEFSMLINMKNDLVSDIMNLKYEDSVFSTFEFNSAKGIELFYKAKTTKDIDSVNKLTVSFWNALYINDNTYNEMVSTGSMYSMKNKELKEYIIRYYLLVEADKNYIKNVNQQQDYLKNKTPEMLPYFSLVNQLRNPKIDLKKIDTTWINNPNSKTYLAVEHYINSNQNSSNIYRRSVFKRSKEYAEYLLAEINKEIDSRN